MKQIILFLTEKEIEDIQTNKGIKLIIKCKPKKADMFMRRTKRGK